MTISQDSFQDPMFPTLINKYAEFVDAMLGEVEELQLKYPSLDIDTLTDAILGHSHLEA